MPPNDHTAFITAVTEIGSRVDALGDKVFQKLDGIKDETRALGERMATVEVWGTSQREALQRWYDKTWPDHLATLNDALKAHGERIGSLEKDRVTLERLETLSQKCIENTKTIEKQQETIGEMEKFQVKLKVYVALAGAISGAIVSAAGAFAVHFLK